MYLIEGNSIKRKYSNKLQHEIIVGSRVITRRKMSITLNGFQHIKKQPQHIAKNIYQKTEQHVEKIENNK